MKPKKRKNKAKVSASISDCQFYGVKWDGESLEVIKNVSQGLKNLTELFKSQNIEIKSLLTIGSEPAKKV